MVYHSASCCGTRNTEPGTRTVTIYPFQSINSLTASQVLMHRIVFNAPLTDLCNSSTFVFRLILG
jgi:hypothetical protein